MVEALSGGRWQGSSTADIPTVSTLNATNGTTNWSADTSKLTKSGNTITFSATGASNDEEIYYDLTSTSDDKWTLRFKADFTSIGAGNNAQHQQLQFGIYDSTNPSGNASGDAIMFYLSSAGNVSNAVNGVNGGTSDITSTNNTPIASSGSAVTYYIELQRTSSSAIQAKVFSDEYVTQVGSTLSKTGLSGITGLRYLMVRLWSEGGAGNGAVGSVTDIKLYNNKSSTTTDEKTTLTNVPANTRYEETDTRKIYRFGGINTSGLKALYNFDSSWSNNATDSDSITTGGDMTAQNNATFSTSVKKLGTASASFPADGDYAKTSTANGANFDFTGDSTVTLWVYRTDGLDSSYHAMVSKRSGGNSEYNLYLEPVSSGVSKPHLYITMGSSTFNGSATGAIPDSTWTHLATTIDGDVMKYYINGALDSTHDLNGAKGTLASQPFGVGAISGTGTEGYQGYLDQVSVWNRALSASEISTIYNSGTGKNIAGWIERNTA